MKKFIAALLALVMVLSLAACSGGSTGTAETPAANKPAANTPAANTPVETEAQNDASFYEVTEPIEIVWWETLESQYDELVKEIVEGFNNSQDLITVKAEYVGSYSDINEKLVAANAAGTGLPALAVSNTDNVAAYGASGLFETLDGYIAATGYDVEDFSTGLLLSSQYDGRQVAMPFLHSTQVIYYNKTLADANGIEVPTKIEDFEAFLKAGQVATNGGYGTVIPGWDQWYFETLYRNEGVDIITADNTCDLNGDAAMMVTGWIRDWCDAGLAYFANGSEASATMRKNFYDGKAFSVMHTSSLYNNYVDKCDFEVGMAWYPAATTGNKYSEVGGCVLGIPSGNDQATKNAAWQFLQYLVGKDVNMKWAEATGYMPTRKSVLETEEGIAFLEKKPAFQCIFDNLDLINPRIQNASWSELATTWKTYMVIMEDNGGDLVQNSEDMVEEINEILAE